MHPMVATAPPNWAPDRTSDKLLATLINPFTEVTDSPRRVDPERPRLIVPAVFDWHTGTNHRDNRAGASQAGGIFDDGTIGKVCNGYPVSCMLTPRDLFIHA